jgi:hypothetical protein
MENNARIDVEISGGGFLWRLYAPEIMMGLYSADEVVDIAANNAKMGK